PNIVIPLPGSANNHQEMNAEYFAGKHVSAVIYEKDLTSERLAGELDEVLSKKEEILKNIRAYKDLTIKDSAKMIAGEICGILARKNFD
ncbi:MAG: glycosyltransferase, partial [Minisyncoccia bacterium]